jgi:hypothetical protein
MPRILPDRCYFGIDEDSIKHTEEHLRRTMRLRQTRFDDTVDRYIKRLSDCRRSRRCNLSACPSCEIARQDRHCSEVLALVAAHPKDAVVCGDVLLEPRDHLQSQGHHPKTDVQRFRKVVRDTMQTASGPQDGMFLLGRYEIAVKRRDANAFLENYAPGDRSRSVIPHFHFVLIARESGQYLNTEEVRRRLVPFFPAPRQMMIRRLMPSQTKREALEARVSYIFKKRTVDFSGRVLRDFVHAQVWFRQDMWTLKYSRGTMTKPTEVQGPCLVADLVAM